MYACAVSLVFLCLLNSGRAVERTFLILNDLHYDPTYWTTQESCVKRIPTDQLPELGTYECEPSWELIESAVSSLINSKLVRSTPSFVIWLGDNTHHARNYSDSVFTKPGFVVDVIQNITNLLKTTFGERGIPVIPVLGNHDYYPKDQLPARDLSTDPVDPIYEALGDMWTDWIGDQAEVDRFKMAGYYSRKFSAVANIRVMVLNTNLYLQKNNNTQGRADPGHQLAWAGTTLAKARTDGEKVIFILHIPVGYDENRSFYLFMRYQQNEALVRIIRDYSDVILAAFSGHSHTDTFKLIYSAAGEPVSTVFVGPAISPWRTFWDFPSHNPAVREVSYLEDLGKADSLIDISQVYLDLADTNPAWKAEYTFRSAFGIGNVSPQAMETTRIKFKEYGSEKFFSYYKYNHVSVSGKEYEPCSCACKTFHICAIQCVEPACYKRCVDETKPQLCAGNSIGASGIFVLLTVVAVNLFNA